MQREINYRLIIKSALIMAGILILIIVAGRILQSIAMVRMLPQARELVENERYDKALELMEAYLIEYPDDMEVLVEYAQLLEKVRRPQRAAETYRRMLQLEPSNLSAIRWLLRFETAHAIVRPSGDRRAARTHYLEAERHAERLLQLIAAEGGQPAFEDLRYLAMIHEGLEERDKARATLERMIKLYPEEEDGYFRLVEVLKEQGQPLEEWNKMILVALEKVPESAALHLSAHNALAAHDPVAAASHLSRARELSEEDHRVILASAIEAERAAEESKARRDNEGAEQHYSRAMEFWRQLQEAQPLEYLPYSMQARLHLIRQHRQEALEVLDAGIDAVTENNSIILRQQKMEALLNERRLEQAREELAALRRKGTATTILPLLEGRLLLAEGRPQEARVLLERAAREMPGMAQAHTLLGRARLETGEPGLARISLQTSLGLRPESVEARILLVNSLILSGGASQAVEEASRLTQLAPEMQEAWLALARARITAAGPNPPPEQINQAIAAAQRAVEIKSNSNAIHLLAQLQAAAGQHQQAEETLSRIPADEAEERMLKTALMHFHHATGRIDQARQAYEEIVSRHGSDHTLELVAARLFQTPEQVEKLLLKHLEAASPGQKPEIHSQLVSHYLETNDFEKARLHLAEIAEAQPQNDSVRRTLMRLSLENRDRESAESYLAEIAGIKGDYSHVYICDKAEFMLPVADAFKAGQIAETLERAINDMPSARAHTLLGDARRKQRNFHEAIRNYNLALRADPNILQAGISLVATYNEAGMPQEARTTLERLLAAAPMSPHLLNLQLDRMIREQDAAGAIAVLERKLLLEPENIESLLIIGHLSMRNNEMQKAEEHLRKAYSLDPHSAAAVSVLAQLLVRTGRRDEAEEVVDRLIEQLPDNRDAYLVRVQLSTMNREFEKAIEDLESILALVPDDKQIIVAIGDTYNEMGRRPNALNYYRKAAALEPPGTSLRRMLAQRLSTGTLAELAEAGNILDTVLQEDPADADAHIVKASLLLTHETVDTAKEHCRHAIQLAPDRAAPRVQLAYIYLNEGDLPHAAELAREAILAEPRNPAAIMLNFEIHMRRGEYGRAGVILDRAAPGVQISVAKAQLIEAERGVAAAIGYLEDQLASYPPDAPETTPMLVRLAGYLDRAGMKQEGLERLRAAYKSNMTSPALLGTLVRTLDRHKLFDETDAILEQAAESRINPSEIKLVKAEILLTRNRSSEELETAEEYLQELTLELHQNSHVMNLSGYLHYMRNDLDRAIKSYQQAHKLAPRDSSVMNNLAWFLGKAGRADEALPLARAAVFSSPAQATFKDTLGEIYRLLGRYDEAISSFEAAFRLNSSSAPVIFRLGRTQLAAAKIEQDEQLKLTKLSQARQSLERALELGPGAGLDEEDKQTAQTLLREIDETMN